MPLFDPVAEIPGYADFLDEQEAIRDTAFLCLPRSICGLPVLPLTTRHILWLLIIKSPFVGGQKLSWPHAHLHVAAFLRIVSPKFSPMSRFKSRLFFWRFRRTIYPQKLDPVKMVSAIKEFLDKQMQDQPAGSGGAGQSYWSIGATIVHALGGYGWSLDEILDTPVSVAFQLIKIQRHEDAAKNGVKHPLFNPSDGFKTRWYDKLERDLKEYEAELSNPARN